MSIALESNHHNHNNPNRIEQVSGGFLRRNQMSPCNLSVLGPGDLTVVRVVVADVRENGPLDPCSSSSSSIGKNSDDEGEDDDEVESKLKKIPFDSAVNALEEALPIRRGISKFYNGKSKSFATLADAACSSIKDITKPENPYTRKRKNLLAYSLLKSPRIGGGGLAKRSTIGCLGGARDRLVDENGSSPETSRGSDSSRTPSVSPPSSPLPPPPWRSFSLADLQHCAANANSTVNSRLPFPLVGKWEED